MRMYFSAFVLTLTCHLSAHEPSYIDMPTQLTLKAAAGIQNNAITESNEAWIIPGVMLGAEATSKDSGASINDVQLLGRLNLDDDYYVASKIGYHQHAGEGELALENFWLGKYFKFDDSIIKVDVGQTSTSTTPTANHHSSQDIYNTSPLLAQVFFGGHHQDTGIKVNGYWRDLEIGIEAWNGDSWPNTSGEKSFSTLARYHSEIYGIKTDIAAWYHTGDAYQRADTRYNSDSHTHSFTTITVPDISYTGSVNMAGSYLHLSKEINHTLSWQAQWEWIRSRTKGHVETTTETAAMNQTLNGYRLMLGIHFRQHAFYAQHELLAVNNLFLDTSVTFLEQQRLLNENFEPQRFMFSYHWQWRPNFTLRIETVNDKTQSNISKQYWSLGVMWQHILK